MKGKNLTTDNGIEITRQPQDTRTAISSGGVEIRRESKPVSFEGRSVKADIIFVIDTTGSMNDEIDGLMKTCQKFADAVAQRNINYRMGIVAFGDLTISPPDKMVQFPLITSAKRVSQAFREILSEHRTSGGGNVGESSIDALWKAAEGFEFQQDAIRVFLLFTDEPPLEPDVKQRNIIYTIKEFKRRKILCFCITIPDERFKRLAKETGGTWFEISSDVNFLSILDQLFTTVADKIEEIALKLLMNATKPAIEKGR